MSDLKEELADLHVRKRAWQALLDSPEWGIVTQTLQAQADAIQREVIFNPLGSIDEALRQEYRKGTLVGLLSVTSTVETAMAEIESEIERLKGRIGNVD